MIIVNIIQVFIVVVSTMFSAVIAALALLVSRETSFWVAKNIWAKSILKIVGSKVNVKGLENLREVNQPVIFCANHLSNFDIIAIYIAVDRPVYFIAKKELSKIPFLGWYMRAAGMVFIDRSNREKAMTSMKEAGELINRGRNIITFPEGTRSKKGTIGKFKKGSFIIAYEGKIPIVPIAIRNSNNVNPTESLKINKTTINLEIGELIDEYNKFDSPENLADFTKNKVIALYNSI